jgi:AcrR family transcriptional regulator
LRRALCDAALALVEERGPKGFTLREAAKRAGVSVAAPYRHFPDKESLLAAVAEEGFGKLKEYLSATKSPPASMGGTAERLQGQAESYVRFAVEHTAYLRVMCSDAIDKRRYPSLYATAQSTLDVLVQAIVDCQQEGVVISGDPRELAVVAWSMVHGISQLLMDGLIDATDVVAKPMPTALARYAAHLLYEGMKSR